jgi:hypothetical protein
VKELIISITIITVRFETLDYAYRSLYMKHKENHKLHFLQLRVLHRNPLLDDLNTFLVGFFRHLDPMHKSKSCMDESSASQA